MKSASHYTMRLRHWISPELVDGRSALDLYGIWQPGLVISYNDICGHPITGLVGELHQVPLASQNARSGRAQRCLPVTHDHQSVSGTAPPGPGRALAYIDYEQQEFGIAAALSGDDAMRAAYASGDDPTGDPYLTFAKQAGAVPADATTGTALDLIDLWKAARGVSFHAALYEIEHWRAPRKPRRSRCTDAPNAGGDPGPITPP